MAINGAVQFTFTERTSVEFYPAGIPRTCHKRKGQKSCFAIFISVIVINQDW